MSLSRFFGGRKSRKRAHSPKPRLFESLENREMMSVTPLYYSSASLSPAVIEQVSTPMPQPQGTLELLSMPSVPAFSSLPGAPATLYLDFDGHFQAEAAVTDGANLTSAAFALDANNQDFLAEMGSIREIWARVAEDYSPFNINVTTVDPGDFSHDSHNLRVVITGRDFTGDDRGGVGRRKAFSSEPDPNVVYVFSVSKGFADDDPAGLRPMKSIGNLVSHEAGHAFGLEHQTALGDDKKAPIMGNANSAERGIWWKGTNEKGNSQDDMAIIASTLNGFGFRPDGPDSFAGAGQLQVGGRGFEGRGVIHETSDVDVYRFDTIGGKVQISVLTARDVIGGIPVNFGNLDAVVELYNNQGQLIMRDAPDKDTTAGIEVPDLAAGSYFVKVLSQGAYGDVGQFQLTVHELTPPRVISANYVSLSSTLAGVWIQFNKPINASTFTTADVTASGVSILGLTADANDPTRFLVTVTPPSGSFWTLTIGPDIRDVFGTSMDQNQNGMLGEAADVYRAFFPGPNLPTLQQVKPTTTLPKKIKLTPVLVDAVFAG
jgi:hypothetical protein